MADDEVPRRSGSTDDLADVLARLGVERYDPDDVDVAPLLPGDVFDDPASG